MKKQQLPSVDMKFLKAIGTFYSDVARKSDNEYRLLRSILDYVIFMIMTKSTRHADTCIENDHFCMCIVVNGKYMILVFDHDERILNIFNGIGDLMKQLTVDTLNSEIKKFFDEY